MKEENNSTIQELDNGKIKYQDIWYSKSLIISNEQVISPWKHPNISDFAIHDFDIALNSECELILLGTGVRQIFPDRYLLTKILKKGKGIEVMDTMSACRTFNVIKSEYRYAIAMLIMD